MRQSEEATRMESEQLRPFYLGMRRREVEGDEPKRKFARVPIWMLTKESIAAVLQLRRQGISLNQLQWIIYKHGQVFGLLNPRMQASYLTLVQNQWEELFRLGFRFGLYTRDGEVYKKEYPEVDLPENHRKKFAAQYPKANSSPRQPKTINELFNRPYGVVSYPPHHGFPRINPDAANNETILAWWSDAHDELLRCQIAQDGWEWWPSTSAIAEMTDSDVFWNWAIGDTRCLCSGWPDVLTSFARARALKKGLLENIVWPSDARDCELCGDKFTPSTHHHSLRKASSLSVRYCIACITDSFGNGNQFSTRAQCLEYVQELSERLGRVPNSGFGSYYTDLGALDETNASDVLRLLRDKPSLERIKDHFGSWLAALIEAGILEDGTRKTARGTQCVARDGHVCLSIAEKTIDDLLTHLNIPHEREVGYPEEKYRCDFYVNGIYIEYFGLKGNPEYDARTREKMSLARKLGIKILALYPEDLVDYSTLRRKLLRLGAQR